MHTRFAMGNRALLHIATHIVESFIADAERDDKKRTYIDKSIRNKDNICLGCSARVVQLSCDLLISALDLMRFCLCYSSFSSFVFHEIPSEGINAPYTIRPA